jgi:hypothetical protein
MRWKPISRRGRRTDGILALFVALGLSPFIDAAVSGKELPRYGVFVFSNECVDNSKNGGGDVEGDRITLLRFQISAACLEHDLEKCVAVFRKDHAQTRS